MHASANLPSPPTSDTRPGNHRPSSHFASTRDPTTMPHARPPSLTAELVLAQDESARGFSSSSGGAFLLFPLPCTHSSQHHTSHRTGTEEAR